MKKLEEVESLHPTSDMKYLESPDGKGVRMRFMDEEPEQNMVRVHLTKEVIRERLTDDYEVPYVALDVSLAVLEELVKAVKKQKKEVSK